MLSLWYLCDRYLLRTKLKILSLDSFIGYRLQDFQMWHINFFLNKIKYYVLEVKSENKAAKLVLKFHFSFQNGNKQNNYESCVFFSKSRELNITIYLLVFKNYLPHGLAYGRGAGNLNWPIRIQQAGKNYCPHVNVSWQERYWNQATFPIGECI